MKHLEAHLATLSLIHEDKEYLKKAEDYIQTKWIKEESSTRKN